MLKPMLILGLVLLPWGCSTDSSSNNSDTGRDAASDEGDAGDSTSSTNGNQIDGGGGSDKMDAGSDASAPEPVSYEVYCETVSRLYAKFLAECYGTPPYDPDEWQGWNARCLLSARAVQDGQMSFDGEQAASCLDVLGTREQCVGNFFESEPACRGITQPQLAAEDACSSSLGLFFATSGGVCTGGWCQADDTTCGTCMEFRQLDDVCQMNDDYFPCEPALYCAPNGRCAARPKQGDPCPDGQCAQDLRCVSLGNDQSECRAVADLGGSCANKACPAFTFCKDGTCQKATEAEDPCFTDSQCPNSMVCARSEASPNNNVCQPGAKSGDACGELLPCQRSLVCVDSSCTAPPGEGGDCTDHGRCAEGHWCRQDSLTEFSCVASGSEDDSCTNYDDNPSGREGACEDGLFCMADGVCRAPGAEGQTCRPNEAGSCQDGLVCPADTAECEAPRDTGQDCSRDTDCASGDCRGVCIDPYSCLE